MNAQELFKKETGIDARFLGTDYRPSYVEWLESKVKKAYCKPSGDPPEPKPSPDFELDPETDEVDLSKFSGSFTTSFEDPYRGKSYLLEIHYNGPEIDRSDLRHYFRDLFDKNVEEGSGSPPSVDEFISYLKNEYGLYSRITR